jgi:hypothetical protein
MKNPDLRAHLFDQLNSEIDRPRCWVISVYGHQNFPEHIDLPARAAC